MSYYGVTMDMYRVPDAGTPGWNLAPVPGWGANPLRAGPPRVGVGCADGLCGTVPLNDAVLPRYAQVGQDDDGYAGDKYVEYTVGHLGFAFVGGVAFGALCAYVWRIKKG